MKPVAKEVNSPVVAPVEAPVAITIFKSAKELGKEKLKKFMEEESVLVKGRFKNYETPNGNATITVKKYPGLPMFKEIMQDDGIYEIPLYVARFLNGKDVTAGAVDGVIHTCSHGIHGFKWDGKSAMPQNLNGDVGIPVPLIAITKRVRRYGFESLEFIV